MTRYGYARVSTREQNPNSQRDALTAAGIAEADIVIEKISGKLASRPKLDKLLAGLERGDAVVVTRLRRIGRNHKHLLELVEWFEANGVDFIVLEQGIDTTTPIGRLFFRFLAALAEFDREAIVEGTLEGLASARARGRVGGRPPKLTGPKLDQAQRMYDDGELTAEEIAGVVGVARSTLYENCPPARTAATASWSSTATLAPARSTLTRTAATARPGKARRSSSRPTASGGTSPHPRGPPQGRGLRGRRHRHPDPRRRPVQRPVAARRPRLRRHPAHLAPHRPPGRLGSPHSASASATRTPTCAERSGSTCHYE